MAGSAIPRRTGKNMIHMALFTGDIDVPAGKRESGAGVIETGFTPIFWGMAAFAVSAKPAQVRIFIAVTGRTIIWGALQIRDRARAGVTVAAGNRRVLPGQLESEPVVIKISTIAVHTIMTFQADCTKFRHMGENEDGFDRCVAVAAYLGIEDG